MGVVICDRAPDALTCEATRYWGNADELRAWIGPESVLESYSRHILMRPDASQYTWLERGDWIVKGPGPGWDFYVIKADKMSALWVPREAPGYGV